ncbi:MAG: polyketide cyclase, partial [Pseudomonadota bacterium]
IISCDPPRSFYVSWEYGDDVSWIKVDLEAVDRGTRLTLKHIMLKSEAGEAHWKKYGPAATGVGWELAFLALDYVLSNAGMIIDAAENAAWMTTAAGKLFMRQSAEKWGEAHARAGEVREIALEMAKQTASFYTGE